METKAVNGRKEEATETGIFFIEEYQQRATIAAKTPKYSPVSKFFILNKLMIDLFIIKAKIKSITPP